MPPRTPHPPAPPSRPRGRRWGGSRARGRAPPPAMDMPKGKGGAGGKLLQSTILDAKDELEEVGAALPQFPRAGGGRLHPLPQFPYCRSTRVLLVDLSASPASVSLWGEGQPGARAELRGVVSAPLQFPPWRGRAGLSQGEGAGVRGRILVFGYSSSAEPRALGRVACGSSQPLSVPRLGARPGAITEDRLREAVGRQRSVTSGPT